MLCKVKPIKMTKNTSPKQTKIKQLHQNSGYCEIFCFPWVNFLNGKKSGNWGKKKSESDLTGITWVWKKLLWLNSV